jgi:hypothetical protein
MDLAWAVENGQRHDSALESRRVELGLLLFTPKPSTLRCCDAVLLPIPHAANHWPATAFAPAQPESRPACTYHRLRLPTRPWWCPSFLCFLKRAPLPNIQDGDQLYQFQGAGSAKQWQKV